MKKYFFVIFIALFPVVAQAALPFVVSLRIDPPYVSPNGDGLHDQIFFYPILPSDVTPTRWRLDIFNDRRKRIHRLSGAGTAALIKWNIHDKKEQILLDGTYSASIEVWSSQGTSLSEEEPFYVDTVAPEVNLQVSTTIISPTADQQVILTSVIHDNSAVDRWQIQILNELGKTVSVEWSTDTVRPVVWDAKDRQTGIGLPPGEYKCILQAWDKAGNSSASAEVTILNQSTPGQSLRQILKKIVVYETYIGLIVTMPSHDLFSKNKGSLSVSKTGEDLLKEVALLVNAYPDRTVRVDGYSFFKKKSDFNKDLSSQYAWTVYSDLVKKENVKASRLTVRGRGKSPLFDRRAVKPNVVQDGVEIVLEGSQTW